MHLERMTYAATIVVKGFSVRLHSSLYTAAGIVVRAVPAVVRKHASIFFPLDVHGTTFLGV